MRKVLHRRIRQWAQASIFDLFATHEIGHELKTMSQWLDEHYDLLGLVARDLCRDGIKAAGRHGLPAEAVSRCPLLKQYRQLSHEPSDSSLLWDAVRIMVRLLKRADALVGRLAWRDHCRAAKRRAPKSQFTRGLAYLKQAAERLAVASNPLIARWQAEVRRYRSLIAGSGQNTGSQSGCCTCDARRRHSSPAPPDPGPTT
jgi:IS5 family transposase